MDKYPPPVEDRPRDWWLPGMAQKRCVYCGTPIRGGRACRSHDDLIPLDPVYREARSMT